MIVAKPDSYSSCDRTRRCLFKACPIFIPARFECVNIFKLFLLITLTVFIFYINGFAIVFERREEAKSQLSYFVYPVYARIPGVGEAYGGGYYISKLAGTNAELIGVHTKGDIQAQMVLLSNIPLLSNVLTISPLFLKVDGIRYEAYDMGSESDPNQKYVLKGDRIEMVEIEFSLHFFQDQLEFYYNLGYIEAAPSSVVDTYGMEHGDKLSETIIAFPYRIGILFDDTDSRRDPRIGYRLLYERWGVHHQEEKLGDGYLEDFDISFYIPLFSKNNVMVMDLFYSRGIITNPAFIDPDDYKCSSKDPPECQFIMDQARKKREEEAKKGNATSLGGSMRLRSYPQNRFYDSYTAFIGTEFRCYLLNGWSPFDYFVFKSTRTSLQIAVFHEIGQVRPENNSSLFKDMKSSTGVGLRLVFNDIVARMDYAVGEEGSQVTIIWGYPF